MGISIKGKNDGGLEFVIEPESTYREIKQAIVDKLDKNKGFFAGAEAKITFSGKDLTNGQRQDLNRLLAMDYNIHDITFCGMLSQSASHIDIKEEKSYEQPPVKNKQINLVSKNYFDANSVVVSHTLRSGQRVECTGDVTVLGDVNVGAEVIAGGSVCVMGILRGLVHAGATGRSDVVIAANALIPGQLRISGKIAVFPAGKEALVPEIAEYKEGSVVIRPLKAQKRQSR